MKNKAISFVNTQSGVKEVFTAGGPVKMYVCGVTPYDYAHMGHARCYVSFDLLYRVLQFWGYCVTYVRGVTDVDDKIVRKAESVAADALRIAREYTEFFNQDMAALNNLVPVHQPTVSGHIPHIVSFIEQLIAKGHAYVAGGDVYFSLDSFAQYGSLSHRTPDELLAGARVEVAEQKRNHGDFVLWKGNVVGSFWESPWGPGRPGWHIECSTFVKEYLGETIDIHGGGIDLLFPHHENECAQSTALFDKPLARYWLHNAHVTLDAEKMSKSLGNVFTVRDVLKEFDPMVVRFYLVQHHYRTPLDINKEHIASAGRAYNRLARAFNPAAIPLHEVSFELVHKAWCEVSEYSADCSAILDALADDMNVPKALGLIFGNIDKLAADEATARAVRLLLQYVLGLSCMPIISGSEADITPEIEALIAQREQARAQKEWALADQLRERLAQLGYKVVDKK